MAKVIFGNHSAVLVPRGDRDGIRNFYGDVADESEFLRSRRSIWLEIKSDDVERMKRKTLDSGVRKLDEDLSTYEGRRPFTPPQSKAGIFDGSDRSDRA